MRLKWVVALLFVVPIFPASLAAQDLGADWQSEVRTLASAQDWPGALRVLDQRLARAPEDFEARAWRARVLTWAARLEEAEREYDAILKIERKDPDLWLGLAAVYQRQNRTQDAIRTLERAIELDPNRADLHAAQGRALRASGDRAQARIEFKKALQLDPMSEEARAGLNSLAGDPKHELRFGSDNDLYNFTGANHEQWTSLVSRWTALLTTSVAGNFYQRGGVGAGEVVSSVTARSPHWGALTVGGAAGHDNGVIPKSQAFFEYDRGWKVGEGGALRGVEAAYRQRWYWYAAARILTLSETATVYFPREWSWSLNITEAHSHFSSSTAEWRPSGLTKLGFPLFHGRVPQLSGNLFFATGTENFGEVDQIGAFSSHTYGGGLRLQFTGWQDVTGYGAFQQRTQNKTDTSFGISYGLHF